MRLKDRRVLITGGGQGIGRAMARRFLEEGAAVAIAELDVEAGREMVAEYAALGEIQAIPADLADPAAVQGAVEQAALALGGLDVLVNNAAISANGPLQDLRLEDWNRVLAVNLTAPLLAAKYAAPHLARQGGCIVNLASTRAFMSEPGTEAYSASKGGIVALTHALAVSLGPAVRVNCIAPGWIETRDWQKHSRRRSPAHSPEDQAQHPVGRVGRPEDVAALAVFLASDEAGFVTGACFTVDGGMTRKMIYA